MPGPLGRWLTGTHREALRESPWVLLGLPDREAGERCSEGCRPDLWEANRLGDTWSQFSTRGGQTTWGEFLEWSKSQERTFLSRAKRNFELQGSQGHQPFPLPTSLSDLQGQYSLKGAVPGVSGAPGLDRAGPNPPFSQNPLHATTLFIIHINLWKRHPPEVFITLFGIKVFTRFLLPFF